MPTAIRISFEDQRQMPITGKINFRYNSADELIWITYDYSGNEFRQQITDTNYSGGTAFGNITRTKTFHELNKQ